MKLLSSVIADLITVLALCAYLALYMLRLLPPSEDFVVSHGPIMWAAFAAMVSFIYAFFQAHQRSILRFFLLFVRFLLCLAIAMFMAFIAYVCWYRPDDHQWSLGAYILSYVALVFGAAAFILGYIARILRDRLTIKQWVISVSVYGVLWCLTDAIGCPQARHHMLAESGITNDMTEGPTRDEFLSWDTDVPPSRYTCHAVAYAPFVVTVEFGVLRKGWGYGGTYVFLWGGILSPRITVSSWIT